MLTIREETPLQPEVITLLTQADTYMAALYPPESNHLLDAEALSAPQVQFYVARIDHKVVGCAALVLGAPHQAELKRMFVDASTRGHGVGRALLRKIETAAINSAVQLLQLETGTKQPEAHKLYLTHGYRDRGPFGEYRLDPLSRFMEKELTTNANSDRSQI